MGMLTTGKAAARRESGREIELVRDQVVNGRTGTFKGVKGGTSACLE
jgi:hypothetical protein